MTHYGTIKTYDSTKGSGSIAPEKGGATLDFSKSDLQQEASEPEQGQRFSYETKKVAGNNDCATNLRQQEQGERQNKGQAGDDAKRDQAGRQQG